MTTKAELLRLSEELLDAFKRIQEVSDANRGLMAYFGSGDDKFSQSFGSLVDTFEPRLDYFRRGISKYADVLLDEKKKENRAKAHEAEKTKRGRKKKNALQ